MVKVDYIIVGLGLAGLAFAEELIAAKKTFMVFEDDSQTSSLVAGGVYNPVILKRFTPVWNAKEQLEIALPFYQKLEKRFRTKFDEKFVIKKVFKSIEDQNNWYTASDKPLLIDYLDTKIDTENKAGVIADFGFGNVKEAQGIIQPILVRMISNNQYEIIAGERRWQAAKIANLKEVPVIIKDISPKRIVFSEGFGMKGNLFFNYLPLNEVKGELITIHAPKLEIDFLIKSTLFVLPLGDNLYKVGATFNWKDKTSNPSEEGRNELIEKLKKVIDVPYEIIDQTAGIRPTVRDRRPLIGVHPAFRNLAILNGLGTRGVMIAPTVAKQLFNHLEKNEQLDPETDIKRFEKK